MSGRAAAIMQAWHETRPSVAVAIPMTWALHRAAMVAHLHVAKSLREDDHLLIHAETAVVSQARNGAIRSFLETDANWLFFVDDDMVVPSNLIDVMTWRADVMDAAYLSGVCTSKKPPYLPTVYIESPVQLPGTVAMREEFGTTLYQYHAATDLVAGGGIKTADATGAACLCLRRDLLEAIPPPWFKFEESGEDLYFCRKVRAAGFEVRVDQKIIVGHVGTTTVGINEWTQTKDDWLAANGGDKPVAELKQTG